MSELLVVEGCTFQCDNGATASIVPLSCVYADEVKCNGNRTFKTLGVLVSLAGYTSTPGFFSGASIKVKSNGQSLVLKNQTITVSLPKIPPPPGPNLPITVSILDAGQSKAYAI